MIIEKGNQEKTKETDANTETVRRFPGGVGHGPNEHRMLCPLKAEEDL